MTHRLTEYLEMAAYHDLDYLGPDPPPLTPVRSLWRCRICQRQFSRSYRQLKRRQVAHLPGCRCRGVQALKADDYHALADRLGIAWLGTHLPPTSRHLTRWKSSEQGSFSAAYHDLAY